MLPMLLTASFFGLNVRIFPILLITSTLAYPHCSPALYGTPVENDCHDIFFDRPWTGNKGLASLDNKMHYFGAVGNPSSRPADVERRQWARRVDLPRTWHDGTLLHLTALSQIDDVRNLDQQVNAALFYRQTSIRTASQNTTRVHTPPLPKPLHLSNWPVVTMTRCLPD